MIVELQIRYEHDHRSCRCVDQELAIILMSGISEKENLNAIHYSKKYVRYPEKSNFNFHDRLLRLRQCLLKFTV